MKITEQKLREAIRNGINKLNEAKSYDLGLENAREYEGVIGDAIKKLEGIDAYHKMAEDGGGTAVNSTASMIYISQYGKTDNTDALKKILKKTDSNLDVNKIKNNFDATDRERSGHDQDKDIWKYDIPKKIDYHKAKKMGILTEPNVTQMDHEVVGELLNMLAAYTSEGNPLANIAWTSLDSFMAAAHDYVRGSNWKKFKKDVEAKYPMLESELTNEAKYNFSKMYPNSTDLERDIIAWYRSLKKDIGEKYAKEMRADLVKVLMKEGKLNEISKQKELSKIETWVRKSGLDYDDWDWDGKELTIFLKKGNPEKYSKEDLEEEGVFEGKLTKKGIASNFKVLLRTAMEEPIGRKIRLGGKRDAFKEVWERITKTTWMNLKTKKKLNLDKFARHMDDYHMTNRELQFERKLNEDILDDAKAALENEYDWTNIEFEGDLSIRFDYDRGKNSMWVNKSGSISGNIPSRNARSVWKALDKLGLKEGKLTEAKLEDVYVELNKTEEKRIPKLLKKYKKVKQIGRHQGEINFEGPKKELADFLVGLIGYDDAYDTFYDLFEGKLNEGKDSDGFDDHIVKSTANKISADNLEKELDKAKIPYKTEKLGRVVMFYFKSYKDYDKAEDVISKKRIQLESVKESKLTEGKLNEGNMNSEILDVVEDLQALIKKLKKDSNYKKRPEVEKLFTYAGPIVKELHKLVESKLNENAILTFSNELNDEGIVAGIFDGVGDGKTVKAQFTKKKWDDGVPVTKFFTRGGYKDIKTPKGKFQLIETPHFWYYEINKGWAAVNKEDYGTPPFEY